MRSKPVALRMANHIKVIHVIALRRDNNNLRQEPIISCSYAAACGVPRIKQWKLDSKNRGLKLVEPAVTSGYGALQSWPMSTLAKESDPVQKPPVIGNNDSTVTERTKILGGIEAEGTSQR